MLICLLLIVLAILAVFLFFFAKVQIFATLQQKLNHKEIFKKLDDDDDGDNDLFCGMID